jgi:hypothetical protein
MGKVKNDSKRLMNEGMGMRAMMTGHSRLAPVLVGFAVAVGALAFASAPALAVTTHPFTGSFGPEGPLSVAGFANVQGVAVDQATGDVYVYDAGAEGGSVYKFDSTGKSAAFSKLAEEGSEHPDVITDVGAAGGRDEDEIAVDSSSGPAKGDIYVANGSHIGVYDADGKPAEVAGQPVELNGNVSSEVPGAPWGEPCGVAVDAAGNVYVGLAGAARNVNRYTPQGADGTPVANGDYTSSIWGLPAEACNLAVDAEGNAFVDTYETGPVARYDASQFLTEAQFKAGEEVPASGTLVDSKGSTLATDPSAAKHLAYVDERGLVAEYETAGELKRLGTFGASGSGALGEGSYGVAANAAGDVYVSNSVGLVNIFGPSEVVKAQIVSEFATNVTSSSANLGAQINPEGFDTAYTLQYSTDSTELCGAEPSACTTISAGDLGSGESGVGVEGKLEGLPANTTYHYRAVAHNVNGTVDGPDRVFTTQSAAGPEALPDGRAYEMVSPLEKSNALLTGIDGLPTGTTGGILQASENGEAIVYASNGAFSSPSAAPLSTQYLATRGAGGWSSKSLIPPTSVESYSAIGHGGPYKAFSGDLTTGLLENSDFFPVRDAPLTKDAPAGYQNFYVQKLADGEFQAVVTGRPGESDETFQIQLQGASPDMRHMIFATGAALTPEAIPGDSLDPNLYEWSEGHLELINLLPGQSQSTPGARLGEKNGNGRPGGVHAISDDGSVVFFTDEGGLYVHRRAASTIEVDESKEGAESGKGRFQDATPDGSRVFFLDRRRLTSDSTVTGEGDQDLYELDLTDGQLHDLTVADPLGADVQRVIGTSTDGAYVYFVANGALAPGAKRGNCPETAGNGPQSCDLYLYDRAEDATRLVTRLSIDDNKEAALSNFQDRYDADDWAPGLASRTARVTPDGLDLVFMSQTSVTGDETTPVAPKDCGEQTTLNSEGKLEVTPGPCQQVYLYDAAGTGQLTCVSCSPTGALAIGESSIPGGTQYENGMAIYQSRVVSDENGQGEEEGARVFFDSHNALVPQDINGKQDVYEWEQDGRGSCQAAGGCTSLISSGTSDTESAFADADPGGKNVFFLTSQQLVPGDTDHLFDLYDAREGGGFPTPPTPPACTGTGCQGVPPAAPIFATPSSATFAGVGNFSAQVAKPTTKKKPTKCAKGKVKRKGKCVKKKAKKKTKAKRASHDRRARS